MQKRGCDKGVTEGYTKMTYDVGFTDTSGTKVRVRVFFAENETDAKYQVAKSDYVKEFRYVYQVKP